MESPAVPPRLTLDLVAFARVMGAVAPCGCTTEPLGGLQYVFGYLGHDIDPQRRLVVEPGGLLIPDPKGPRRRTTRRPGRKRISGPARSRSDSPRWAARWSPASAPMICPVHLRRRR
ncbi:hypothetical protein [Nannocystis pusilla]|uniref:hypothetical protein n=1 Tax=Nannocystis pusilla TaxID=889268 RepID=UPI003B7B8C6A